MSQQTTRTRKAKKEVKKAEEFIAAANEAIANGDVPTKPKRQRRKPGDWPCTAEDIERERDTRGLSWRQVAANLGLTGPSAARKAYEELTGRPHHTSQMTGKRAPRGTVGRKVDSPGWNDDSDQEEIEKRLNGEWIEEQGSGQNYVPAHWSGSLIVVKRSMGKHEFEEEVQVKFVTEFSFGKNGDQPLQVTVIDKHTGGFRCFRVADIQEVR